MPIPFASSCEMPTWIENVNLLAKQPTRNINSPTCSNNSPIWPPRKNNSLGDLFQVIRYRCWLIMTILVLIDQLIIMLDDRFCNSELRIRFKPINEERTRWTDQSTRVSRSCCLLNIWVSILSPEIYGTCYILICSLLRKNCACVFETLGRVLGFIWGGMFVSSSCCSCARVES